MLADVQVGTRATYKQRALLGLVEEQVVLYNVSSQQ